MPSGDKVTALIWAGNRAELALVSMSSQLSHFENEFTAVAPVPAHNLDFLNHVTHYPMSVFNFEVTIAPVRTLMLSQFPYIDTLSAEAPLT